eukprot:TRINITY_DN2_c0_g4_i1.p1 TRINITY_DN2_c0_g4~~TRINITY_DN2_c0_g4_i1.p1  ORF type:complete len:373 (+),score=115.37 TRINITY_DN2_c0_g4_i1:47-1165(+)
MAASDSVFVGDLPGHIDESTLNSVFGAYGTISSSKLFPPGMLGTKSAIISYASVDEAKWLVENLNGNIPEGLEGPVQVRFKDSGKGKGKCKGGDAPAWGQAAWSPKGAGKDGGVGGDAAPNKTVFIGNLPKDMDESMLHSIFGAYGSIVGAKLLDVSPLGFRGAIVEFATIQEATWLVENLDGNLPEGLTGTESLKVNFKQQNYGKAAGNVAGFAPGPYDMGKGGKCGKPGKGKDGKGGCTIKTLVDGLMNSGAMPGGVKYNNDENTLFVGGLPADTTDLDLFWIFSPFGAIPPRGVKAMLSEDRMTCKGFGFVNFSDPNSTSQAIATLNGTQMPDGSVLTVSVKREFSGGGKGGKEGGKGGGKDFKGKGKW